MENAEMNAQEANTNGEQNEIKTFTQEEVNAIIDKRYGRLMEKFADYEELKAKAEKFDKIEEESKSELQKATERADSLQTELDQMKKAAKIKALREDVSKDTGVPANLLTGETKEECEEQAKAIMSFAKPNAYPVVSDKGEVSTAGKTGSTRDLFSEWASETLKGGI